MHRASHPRARGAARGRSPWRVLVAAVALVAAIGCGLLAVGVDDELASAGPRGVASDVANGAALWSARRVPQPFVGAVGARRLQVGGDAVLAGPATCYTVSGPQGVLAGGSVDRALIPASTLKVVVGAGALAILGPDTTLRTRVVAPAVGANGVVDRLYLVGGGDPFLATDEYRALLVTAVPPGTEPTTSLEALADAVVAKGVRRVTGGVVGDDSRHDTIRYQPTWPDTYRTEGQTGPLGALTVNHGFSAFRPRPVPVVDPALYAASEFARVLAARGVVIGAPAGRGRAPEGLGDLALVESAPVSAIVEHVLRASDNLASELLLREMGVKVSRQGTTPAGVQALSARLVELGIPVEGMVVTDGSGLDRGNRLSCRTLAGVVALGAQPAYSSLWEGLAVAGVSGTLADEMLASAVTGKLRAKTGFLNGVTGLAGTVAVGPPLQFVFLANGTLTEPAAIRLRAAFADVLGRYPDAPAADELVPLPGRGS